MNKEVYSAIDSIIEDQIDIGVEELHGLARRLSLWATTSTTNKDSRLRETSYALAGAIMDWAQEIYPDHVFEEPNHDR